MRPRVVCPVFLLFAFVVACVPPGERARRNDTGASARLSDSLATRANPDSLSRQFSASDADRSLVHPGGIPPAVRAACDSALVITHESLGLPVRRDEGIFFDSSRDTPRNGCRLTGNGSFKTISNQSGPVDALHNSFVRHGWRHDLRWGADGPDGAAVGMRRRDMLCIVSGRWNGGDDSHPDTAGARTEDDSYQIFVECARDVAPNNDGEVPDSIWSIASGAGLDSLYAISLALRAPPYEEVDFDGDGLKEAAVLVENRSTGKIGIVIVNRRTRQATILGAGSGSAGPDDLGWIDVMDVYHNGSIDTTIGDRPNSPHTGDALWVARRDSVNAFYIWTSRGFVYEAHKR